jgi:hypothetical protein
MTTPAQQLQQLLQKAMPMDTSSGPGPIISTLGKLDDELQQLQNRHAALTGKVKRNKVFMDTYIGTLYALAAGETVTEKKENAKGLLHDSDEYKAYLDDVAELAELDKKFDYIEARKGIGQSVLKALDKEDGRFGQGARSLAGTPEPS